MEVRNGVLWGRNSGKERASRCEYSVLSQLSPCTVDGSVTNEIFVIMVEQRSNTFRCIHLYTIYLIISHASLIIAKIRYRTPLENVL